MVKRKRAESTEPASAPNGKSRKQTDPTGAPVYIQIVTGSYERALHGITAAIPSQLLQLDATSAEHLSVSFTDSFLFNAHTSAIRCLALSPPPPTSAASQKIILATGSTDERVNLYHLSTRPPSGPILPSLGSKTLQNPSNRSLGILHTHDAGITALHFPNRTKLLSSCGNNLIAITSTKNWSTLSMIKAPTPKHPNRPTGDTSTASTLPSGVNDFAIHPSMKLMISVGRAERCMRLWNLVTGRKAGVLGFERDMLKAVGEGSGRWGSGEGRRVLWNTEGLEFAIGFERGVCVFGMDCKPMTKILPFPPTKIHQMHYIPVHDRNILSLSTEDGRILFYSTQDLEEDATPKEGGDSEVKLPPCLLVGQLGGVATGFPHRIKDYSVLTLHGHEQESESHPTLFVVTAGSDGAIRVWAVEREELLEPAASGNGHEDTKDNGSPDIPQVGRLLGTYETGNRITCLQSFLLTGEPEDGSARNGAEQNEEDESEKSTEDSE